MKRLTKKVGDNYCSQSGDFYDLYNKLGRLEDLEEELGCPLEVVFKALTNGIYTHWNWNCDLYDETEELSYIENIYFGKNPFDKISLMFGYKKESTIDLKDYKKTWWLKEDKSE